MSELQNSEFKARLSMAQDDTTSVDVLAKLAIDISSQIRRAVALNPSTPTDTLLKLGEEFPNEITENPIFFLLLLEDPDSYFVRLSLARSTTTDEATLIQLFEVKNRRIRCAIAQNPKTPIFILEKFVQKCYEQSDNEYDYSYDAKIDRILIAFVQNPSTPEFLLHQIAQYGSAAVKKSMIQNPNTSASILEELASAERFEVDPQDILNHPNVSQTAIIIINAIQGKRGIPIAVLEKLVNHQNPRVRRGIAGHPELTLELLLKLSEDSRTHWDLLDRRANLPTLIIDRIAESTFSTMLSPDYSPTEIEDKVIFWMARHQNTSIAILETLASNQPAELYQQLGAHKFEMFRAAVARNPSTPTQLLKQLSRDPKIEVRAAAQEALKARKIQ